MLHSPVSVHLVAACLAVCAALESFSKHSRLQPRQNPTTVTADKFLRRNHHSIAVGGNYLYIDGGHFSYLDDNDEPQFLIANSTLSIDLSKDWQNSTVTIKAIDKPPDAPYLNAGALWYYQPDDKLYTGFAGDPSTFDRDNLPKPPLSLWSIDLDDAGGGQWSEALQSNADAWNGIVRPTRASYAQSPDSAFLLDGQDPEGQDLRGLVQLNLRTLTFTNVTSTEPFLKSVSGGALQFVPTWGPKGLILALGGLLTDYEWPESFLVPVFDVDAQKWYNQTISGKNPTGRSGMCVAGIESTSETFEIFYYGGSAVLGERSVEYDDIWILTLPSFHWIQVPYKARSPRNGHRCASVGGSQIITVGGGDPNTREDGNPHYDQFRSPDPFKQGLGVFNLTSLKWQDRYIASPSVYEQSDPIKQHYREVGESYVQSLNPSLAEYFKSPNPPSSSKAAGQPNASGSVSGASSNSSSSGTSTSSTNTGAIAGGVVGGIAAVAIIVGVVFVLLRRKKRKSPNSNPAEDEVKASDELWPAELHQDARRAELKGQSLQELSVDVSDDRRGPRTELQ